MRAGYALTQPLPCFRCADRRNARGFVALRNAIAPNWAESDYFAPSNAIVHEPLVLHTPICGFSRDGGRCETNSGMFALCLQFEYLRRNAHRWRSVPKAGRRASASAAVCHPPASRRANHYPTLLRFAFNNISPHILAEVENWKLRQADYGV